VIAAAAFIGGLYAILVLWMIIQFSRLNNRPSIDYNSRVPLTIIVPFRNEEQVLKSCLEDLAGQIEANFQVLCVDDHSEDSSIEIVKEIAAQDERFQLLMLKHDKGKKAALIMGIEHAKTEWIITRDADTFCTQDNLVTISNLIDQSPEKKMFVLPVKSSSSYTFWQALTGLEFHSLVASGIAFAKGGAAIMANGANLVFQNSLYKEIQPYRDNMGKSSGDDTFFLHKVGQINQKWIGTHIASRSAVSTPLPKSPRVWIQQRIRWASKFSATGSLANTTVGSIIWITNVFIVVCVFGFLFESALRIPLLIVWSAKMVIDFLFAAIFEKAFDRNSGPITKLILTLIYPFLIVLTGVMSLFVRPKWKGRKIEV